MTLTGKNLKDDRESLRIGYLLSLDLFCRILASFIFLNLP